MNQRFHCDIEKRIVARVEELQKIREEMKG